MVKLNVSVVEDKVIIQKVYGTNMDFAKTREQLNREGYHPIHHSAGRRQQEEAGNLVFCLKSGIKVNISPKNKLFYKIQIAWNNRDNPEVSEKKLRHELMNIFVPSEDEKLFIIPLSTNKSKIDVENDDEILDKLSMKALLNP